MRKKIREIAKTIRSKNAGSFMITLEIIFDDRAIYDAVKLSGSVSEESIANAYGIDVFLLDSFMFYDPGMAIKANIRRLEPSGGPGETDVYGCQQYAPLLEMEIDYECS